MNAFVVVFALLLAGNAAAAPVLPREEIEADWLNPQSIAQAAGVVSSGGNARVTVEQDAAGGCDGVKTGGWGFHTADEVNPWWQVDLGKVQPLARVVIYNRCDALAVRNSRLVVSVSDDGQTFRQAYQHDGTVFYGFTDKKPLTVALHGSAARFVRLHLVGKSYLHLDEVEIFGPDSEHNLALHQPATQSSVSEWSVAHAPKPAAEFPVAQVIERGLKLAEDLRSRGVDVAVDVARLRELQNATGDVRQRYLDARWAVRKLALKNPLLDFDALVFAKSAPAQFPHMSDQFYGWWSRPGGGVFVLENFKTDEPRGRCLTADMPAGSFLRPELSYDGKKILFAYCRYHPEVGNIKNKVEKANLPEDAFYHVFEMNIEGSGRRQLTHGRYDDFDARYLPSGEIVFLSTRKGQFLQCSAQHTAATLTADLPDSYVRCGGDNFRPVPVFTLHVMDARGANLRPISAFETFEYTPSVADDGRVLYTRWDYIDRFNGHFFSLWSTNPDGTNPQLVYGNYTVRPQAVTEARPIPNSPKLIFTAGAHHSILGGSLVLFDRRRGTEENEPITRLTPEIPFPETEKNVGAYYVNPFPLSEQQFLVAWSNRALPPHCRVDSPERNPVNALGLYLYDAFGNLTLLYRDPAISSGNPIPVRRQPRPQVYSTHLAHGDASDGRFLLQDVYQGLPGIARGTVKSLRIVASPPKVQPHMNQPCIGVSHEDPGKFVIGTVPVEADGSAYFRVPSGMPVFFQALDAEGLALQTMRSLTYVWPDQTFACVGCHEHRDTTPLAGKRVLAAQRPASQPQLGPSGTWPLRFDELVQPALDKACVKCHRAGSEDAQAARFDLTAAKAYENLLNFGAKNLHKLAFERDRSIVGECPARQSKLLALLKNPAAHAHVHVDGDTLTRLITWMDLYAQKQGGFSDAQHAELAQLRERRQQPAP